MMSRVKKRMVAHFLTIILFGLAPIISQAEGVVIIGNKGIIADTITFKQAKKLWLGKVKKLGAEKVTVADQIPENMVYDIFYSKVIKKNASQLKAYWAKKTFTGKGYPPKKLKDDAAILEWVANTPGAIGYVDSTTVNATVKTLLTAK